MKMKFHINNLFLPPHQDSILVRYFSCLNVCYWATFFSWISESDGKGDDTNNKNQD